MNAIVRQSELLLLGGVLLFASLVVLLSIDTDISGKATAGTLANITNSSPRNCTLTVYSGLNTVSFPCILVGIDRSGVINDTGLWAMYQYIPGASDPWKVHNPNLPSYVVSDLQYLSRKTGYVMINNDSQNYIVGGYEILSTIIPLAAGWNLVGYPSFNIKNASDSFGQIDNFTEARTYDNPGGTYLSYDNPAGGTLNYTSPGEGFWINATKGTTWTVTSS